MLRFATDTTSSTCHVTFSVDHALRGCTVSFLTQLLDNAHEGCREHSSRLSLRRSRSIPGRTAPDCVKETPHTDSGAGSHTRWLPGGRRACWESGK